MKTSCLKHTGLLRRFAPASHLPLWAAWLLAPFQAALPLPAEIPEPPTLFYGQVVNRTSGQAYVLTNGTLVWRILPLSGGGPVVLTTSLESVAGGTLSYQLTMPHQALAPGATVAPGNVPLTAAGADYQHLEITIDGFPAQIASGTGDPLRLAQAARATAYRVDLELFNPLADSDGDGLPDWWEDRYGFDKFFADDAGLDRDGDGASNLREFLAGSDPNTANTSPKLATDRIPSLESGIAGVRLQVLDSDSEPGDLRYTLRSAPTGGALYLRNASAPAAPGDRVSDRVLLAGDTFTQTDVNAGRLLFRHQDSSVGATSMELVVNDENPEHPASTGTVAIAVGRQSATESARLALWLDANRAAAQAGTSWRDNSGNHFDAQPPADSNPSFDADSAGGNRSLRLEAGYWGLSVPDEATAFPPGDRTVLAVFKAIGAGRQQVLGGTRFELGVTALDDPLRPGQLRFATEGAALYSPCPVQGQWLLASVWEQSGQAHLELNGLWSAGPEARVEATVLANKSAVGGKAVGRYDPVTGSWEFQAAELLSGQVGEILVFKRALSSAERRRLNYALLSKWFGCVLWDASAEARPITMTVPSAGFTAAEYTNYVAVYGRDRRNILLGGAGADELRGGMEADILAGGRGDDRAAGGGGPDVFVVGAGDGNDTLLDFQAGEGDVLDLSDLLVGASRNLADYVQFSTVGTHSWLRVNTSGAGSGFTNAEITLVNTVLRQSDLEYLWGNGNVVARGIRVDGPAWLNVAASRTGASEEGPIPGEFTVSRSGPTENGLTVNLSVSGSAVNGVDYSFIGPVAVFAPGQSSLKVEVRPYADSSVEVPEVVELLLLAGSGYRLGSASRAQVTIADLPERISVEAFAPLAARSSAVPGYLLVNRSGVVDRSRLVRLNLGGTAVNGIDYQYVSGVLMLDPGQSSALIPITPVVTRPPITGAKLVELTVLPDPNSGYLLGASARGRVWLVEEILTLGLWRARSLPGAANDLVLLAGQDPDQDGLVNLVEYSLGSNPAQAESVENRARMPRARIRGGHLAVEFEKRVAATDLEYLVEVSGDLVTWRSGTNDVEQVTPPELADRPETVCFQDRTPGTGAGPRYIRVRVKFLP